MKKKEESSLSSIAKNQKKERVEKLNQNINFREIIKKFSEHDKKKIVVSNEGDSPKKRGIDLKTLLRTSENNNESIKSSIPKVMRREGQKLQKLGKHTEATEYFYSAYQKFSKEKNLFGKASIIIDIASICMQQDPKEVEKNKKLKNILKDYYRGHTEWKEEVKRNFADISKPENYKFLFIDGFDFFAENYLTKEKERGISLIEAVSATEGIILSIKKSAFNNKEEDIRSLQAILKDKLLPYLKEELNKEENQDIKGDIQKAINKIEHQGKKISSIISDPNPKLLGEDFIDLHFFVKDNFEKAKTTLGFEQKYVDYVFELAGAKEKGCLDDEVFKEFITEIYPKVKEQLGTNVTIQQVNDVVEAFNKDRNSNEFKKRMKEIKGGKLVKTLFSFSL